MAQALWIQEFASAYIGGGTVIMKQLAASCVRTDESIIMTKDAAAQQQLEGSIAEMFAGNWACAITLAGASEEMLVRPENVDDFWSVSKKYLVDKMSFDKKVAIKELNDKRDWLKHNQKDNYRTELNFDQLDAVIMIFRAASRFAVTVKEKSPNILVFEEWAREQYPDWFGVNTSEAKQ